MAEHDIVIPFGFMLTRPFQRYDMCSAILCKSGAQLGNTYMGHNDFQLTVSNTNAPHIDFKLLTLHTHINSTGRRYS